MTRVASVIQPGVARLANRKSNYEFKPHFRLVSKADLQTRLNSVILYPSDKWVTLPQQNSS